MSTPCFIWNVPAEYEPSKGDGQFVISPRAGGRYFISGTALAILQNRYEELPLTQKIVLSEWIFKQNYLGRTPEVTRTMLNWSETEKVKTVSDRAHGLLLAINKNIDSISHKITWFDYISYVGGTANLPLEVYAACSSNELTDVEYLADYLNKIGLISNWDDEMGFTVTPSGFEHISESGSTGIDSEQVFVAMWFSKEMDNAYFEGISPAIKESGYSSLRIDQKDHNNKIDDEIIKEIKKSKFIIADFTSGFTDGCGTLIARGGVYYEAGLAQGLGIPVIWTCHQDCIAHVHFDTRQYNHIVWISPDDLKTKLINRIGATIT